MALLEPKKKHKHPYLVVIKDTRNGETLSRSVNVNCLIPNPDEAVFQMKELTMKEHNIPEEEYDDNYRLISVAYEGRSSR